MKQKQILGVAIDIPGDRTEYVSVTDKQSLADGDIVVIEPDISSFYDHLETNPYQGKPALSETGSFLLKEAIQHWQREVAAAVAAGKTVFLFLTELQEVFVDTGERTHSGTGRNRQTTRIVSKVDSYQLLSLPVSIVNSSGKSIKLAPKADIIAPYWSLFESMTSYKVHIDGKVTLPLLLSRDGKRTVGAIIRYKDSPGHIVLLPPLEIDIENMTYQKEGGTFWNKQGIAFGNKLTDTLIAIDKQLHAEQQTTPQPPWASANEYSLPKETILESELLRIQEEIQKLTDKTKLLQVDIRRENAHKKLLYANGSELEDAIHSALQVLGFKTSRFRDSESEFDVVFESKEGRFIGEAEGKNKKAINIDKLRQLDMNVHEDFSRDEVVKPAKGVLFGNAFRLTPPSERDGFFTDKCITAAKRSGIALIRTPDLFTVVKALKTKPDKRYATACRKAIFAAEGSIVSFPSIPDDTKKNNMLHTTRESDLLIDSVPIVEN